MDIEYVVTTSLIDNNNNNGNKLLHQHKTKMFSNEY